MHAKFFDITHSLSLVHDRLGLHADLDVDGGELAHEVEEDVGQVDVLSGKPRPFKSWFSYLTS